MPGIAFCPTEDGRGFYGLTRYADVQTASSHPKVFSSEPISTSLDDLPESVQEYAGSMISLDAPRHTRLRRIVARAFTPRMVDESIEHTRNVAREVVDDLQERGACDFVATVATPMTMRVLCRILGIPKERHAEVLAASDLILAAGDPDFGEDRGEVLASKYKQLHEFTRQLAQERLREPADDLITRLVTANIDGEALTQEEVGKFFTLLMVAGTETTRNAITHTLALLTERPDQRSLLMSDLNTHLPTTIEEVVRYTTPTTWMRRTLTEKVEFFGHTFEEGDRVILFYNSANRDETVFDDPDTFLVTRSPNPHVGFGAGGPHFCLGTHLARQEMHVLLTELFTRMPNLHATSPGVRHRSSFVNGFQSLPCDF
ncbi:cytochrome P450 [Streptomyces sp. 6N223]|uniref:cytochrome P450 n=1 Tax=Streptomyces sp. 6N223 TaxID=3457412 RepID=UPI003FCFE107